jgi:nicotinic acid mononucleotide adenylyltransferase
MMEDYLRKVRTLALGKSIRRITPTAIHSSMSTEQGTRYLLAVREVLEMNREKAVSPEVLFRAAEQSLSGEASCTEAHIGLQPGTMNPVHYGHITASLAAIIVDRLDLVLLMNAGAVPEKPHAPSADVRHEMLRLAVGEKDLAAWLWASPIRQQLERVFSTDRRLLMLFGKDQITRRSTMDLAAFIWLFRANPKVKWTYLVGSDKVSGYGRKGEYDLLVNTLGDSRANAQVMYFTRADQDVDVQNDIAPYSWLLRKWQSGFIKKSLLPSCEVSSTDIRQAIAKHDTQVNGVPFTEVLPTSVIDFIHANEGLCALYAHAT